MRAAIAFGKVVFYVVGCPLLTLFCAVFVLGWFAICLELLQWSEEPQP